MEYFGHHYAKSEEDYKHEMMALRNIPHKTTSQLVDQMDCVKHVVNMHHAPRGGNHGGSHATSHSTGSSSSSSHHRRSTGNLKDLKSSPKQQSAHQLTHSHHHHHESSASDHHKSTHKKH
ncbi:hypothetical protein C9374_011825 [Naegleria lovaniensis]|uniref:Uncharacterized protein n=1 Tax=Naegleria lovaniensis TaxID=51637 RepID=A0AA88GC44_NAELO|nr:uncharacterized protein C9374_011825 [Naegleria lovaniensis]KAG2373736.1 hypothetical protein C9374_011825 [Naegleria lovaniensis]